MPENCNVVHFSVFATVNLFGGALEVFTKNGITLVWEWWWLKLGLGYQEILFLLLFWCHCLQ